MTRRSRLVVTVLLGILVLSISAPAHSATRLRVFKGETSQGHGIKVRVARSDAGRFVREMDLPHITVTCEDQTTVEFAYYLSFGRTTVPIVERELSFDDVFGDIALHVAGELGSARGEGTLSFAMAQLTPDEQAQLCTTGDLTWEVDYVRTIRRG